MSTRAAAALGLFVALCVASCAPRTSTSKPQSPTSGDPVTASFAAESESLRAGEQFDVTVQIRLAQGWHIYAVDRPTGMASPTQLELELPAGIEMAGEWVLPAASPSMDSSDVPTFSYDDDASFRCPLRVAADAAPGEQTIRCRLWYQACERFSCRPPTEKILETTVRVIP